MSALAVVLRYRTRARVDPGLSGGADRQGKYFRGPTVWCLRKTSALIKLCFSGQTAELGFGFRSAIEDTRSGRGGRVLAGHHCLEAFLDKLLAQGAGSGDGRQAGVEGRSNLAVAQCFAGLAGIRLQQDARLHQLLRRVLAGMDQAIELLSLRRAELHDVLLHGDFFRGHELAPPFVTEPSIQRFCSLPTTGGTGLGVRVHGNRRNRVSIKLFRTFTRSPMG
jgi:hypothetical protein